MKAMILAAGLGTRLKPWTLEHPKALVPVNGVPMLERVILKLKENGFNSLVINVHHFADQIIDFLANKSYGIEIAISDETGKLLDTGGGILHAEKYLQDAENNPFLVHNVDILSDANLPKFMEAAKRSEADAFLLTSDRESSRKLLFDSNWKLTGWKDMRTGATRLKEGEQTKERAFSGIYAIRPSAIASMPEFGERFPIMDWFLSPQASVEGFDVTKLNIIDIGKPETLSRANMLFDKGEPFTPLKS